MFFPVRSQRTRESSPRIRMKRNGELDIYYIYYLHLFPADLSFLVCWSSGSGTVAWWTSAFRLPDLSRLISLSAPTPGERRWSTTRLNPGNSPSSPRGFPISTRGGRGSITCTTRRPIRRVPAFTARMSRRASRTAPSKSSRVERPGYEGVRVQIFITFFINHSKEEFHLIYSRNSAELQFWPVQSHLNPGSTNPVSCKFWWCNTSSLPINSFIKKTFTLWIKSVFLYFRRWIMIICEIGEE